MTFGQQAGRLAEYIRNIAADEARRRINLAYLRCSEMHTWRHLLKRFTLQTEASYTTGSVAASGTALTGTGTTWLTSWTTAPSMRRVAVQGRSEPYDVTIVSGTSATLADTWVGSSDSGLTYRMFRDVYTLPTDCGMAKVLVIYDPELRYRLRNYTQPKFLDVRASDNALVSIPECFTVINQTTETPPRPQIQMYPAPSAVRVYHGWYFRRPAFLTADASYLDWPEEFDDLIWLHSAIEHFETPMFYSPKYLEMLRPKYSNLYNRMKTEMDGQASIDVEIEQAQTGGAGYGWNPDPLGLVGGGSVSWE
jgi:hypothetical protein